VGETPGGQGDAPSRSDLRLEEQAVRNDWPIPPTVKRQILQRLIDYLDRACDEGATAPDRVVIAAARVLAQFGSLSLRQATLDLAREKFHRDNDQQPQATLVELAKLVRERLQQAQQPGDS